MIKNNLLKTNVSVNSWREAVNLAGSLLQKEGYINGDYIDSMIETIEELGPYMILLPKVAFFHGRPSKAVNKVGLSLIVLNESVFFEEFENQEIKAAFAFCAKDQDSHLEILKEFSNLLQNEKLVNLLINNGSKEEILQTIEGEL